MILEKEGGIKIFHFGEDILIDKKFLKRKRLFFKVIIESGFLNDIPNHVF